MATKKTTKAQTVRLSVIDVNPVANTIFLEGVGDDLKYTLMIDAELDGRMMSEVVIGDKWDVTFKNAIKFKFAKTPTVTPGTSSQAQLKGNVCIGSGTIVDKKKIFSEKAKGYSYKVQRIACPDCGKHMAVSGGYNGKPQTVRKHKV